MDLPDVSLDGRPRSGCHRQHGPRREPGSDGARDAPSDLGLRSAELLLPQGEEHGGGQWGQVRASLFSLECDKP